MKGISSSMFLPSSLLAMALWMKTWSSVLARKSRSQKRDVFMASKLLLRWDSLLCDTAVNRKNIVRILKGSDFPCMYHSFLKNGRATVIHTLKIWEQHNMSDKIKLDAHFSVLFKINSSFFFSLSEYPLWNVQSIDWNLHWGLGWKVSWLCNYHTCPFLSGLHGGLCFQPIYSLWDHHRFELKIRVMIFEGVSMFFQILEAHYFWSD